MRLKFRMVARLVVLLAGAVMTTALAQTEPRPGRFSFQPGREEDVERDRSDEAGEG